MVSIACWWIYNFSFKRQIQTFCRKIKSFSNWNFSVYGYYGFLILKKSFLDVLTNYVSTFVGTHLDVTQRLKMEGVML